MATVLRRTELNECRRCLTFCDRVIAPATCVADGCPYLYAYDDPLSGRRFMGCIQQVFASEMAIARGHDVDQPRNLAKSVTVE